MTSIPSGSVRAYSQITLRSSEGKARRREEMSVTDSSPIDVASEAVDNFRFRDAWLVVDRVVLLSRAVILTDCSKSAMSFVSASWRPASTPLETLPACAGVGDCAPDVLFRATSLAVTVSAGAIEGVRNMGSGK